MVKGIVTLQALPNVDNGCDSWCFKLTPAQEGWHKMWSVERGAQGSKPGVAVVALAAIHLCLLSSDIHTPMSTHKLTSWMGQVEYQWSDSRRCGCNQ